MMNIFIKIAMTITSPVTKFIHMDVHTRGVDVLLVALHRCSFPLLSQCLFIGYFNAHYCNNFFNIKNADKVSTLTCESQLYEIPYRPFNTYSSDLLLDELF